MVVCFTFCTPDSLFFAVTPIGPHNSLLLALNWPLFKSVTMPCAQTVIAWPKLWRKA